MYQKSWWYDLQFLRYRVWQTELRNMGHCLPFYPSPLKTWKIRNLKKWRKLLEISSFYTCLPKTTDILFCNFESFFALLLPPNNLKNQNFEKNLKNPVNYHHFTLVYHKQQSHDKWFQRYGAWHIFSHFGSLFALSSP